MIDSGSISAASWPVVVGRGVAGLALAVGITIISLRLLGIRRGWGTALLSGLLGWGLAVVVALGLTGWDWGSDGLVPHIVAIGVPATMAAAVLFDLLARPGSLALGERAGLVVAPRPLRAVQQRVSILLRYRELLRLARREGFAPRFGNPDLGGAGDSQAVRLRRVLEEAGGVYVKLGQIAATRVDLLPADVCAELALLQNQVPPASRDDIATVLSAELGDDFERLFAEFEWEPLAAASIGQTHRARLHSGESVVVKVQRPGIEVTMERDLAALGLLANLAQRRTSFGSVVRSGELLDQFAEGLRAELDFRREADAMTEMAARLDGAHVRACPRLHRNLCTRRILVQERFDGQTVSNLGPPPRPSAASADAAVGGVDRAELANRLLLSTLDQVLRLGLLPRRSAPGQRLRARRRLARTDRLRCRRAPRSDPAGRDRRHVPGAHTARRRACCATRSNGSPSSATRRHRTPLEHTLARMMADHVRPGGTIDPDLMQEMVSTLARFGVRLPTDIVLLSRALVTVDGTLRVLSPSISLMSSAIGVLESPAGKAIVDRDRLVRDELLALLPHVRRLPERVDRILTLTSRGELQVRTVFGEDSRRTVRTLVNRTLLGGLGAALLFVSAILLVADDAGPAVADRDRPVRGLRLRRPARRDRARAARRRRRHPGRHDMSARRLDRGRVAGGAEGRPTARASATTAIPATSSGSSAGAPPPCSSCCSSRSPRRRAMACATTSVGSSPPSRPPSVSSFS